MIFAETLAELESAGDVVRFLDRKGRIAWKASSDLCDYLRDLRIDAEADFENEDT